MESWNSSHDWTRAHVRVSIFNAMEKNTSRLCLDVEHASAHNVENIIAWADEMGWDGEENPHSETVTLIRRDGPFDLFLHVTPASAVPDIQKNGLIPRIGSRSARAKEKVPAIYLFASETAMEDAVANWLGEEFSESEGLAVLEIRLPIGYRTDLSQDPQIRYKTRCRRAIPARYITMRTREGEGPA